MARGFGSVLQLDAPAARPREVPPPKLGETAAFAPNAGDRGRRQRLRDVTLQTLANALDTADQSGNLEAVARVQDAMLTHPILGGIADQRVDGLPRIEFKIKPGNASPRAALIAEETRAAIEDPDSSWSAYQKAASRARLRGAGLCEIGWTHGVAKGNLPAWRWTGFVPVYMQRLRYHRTTGELCFAWRSTDYTGVPISSFDLGTWAHFEVDTEKPNYSDRGVLRRVMDLWFDIGTVSGLRVRDIERWGVPPIDYATDDPTDFQNAKDNINDIGAMSAFVHGTGTKVSALSVPNPHLHPHGGFEDDRIKWAAICLLGASQSVTVAPTEGSQQSVAGHMEIRADLIQGDALFFASCARRDVCVPFAILNHGLDAAEDAAIIEPQLERSRTPQDIIAEIQAAEAIGVDTDEEAAYAALGRRKPGQGKSLREVRELRPPRERTNVLPFPQKGGAQ